MMPAISNITLFFITTDRNKITAITKTAPAKAPATTERKPESTNSPATMLPPPANKTSATPRLAPELIPKIEESASGLLNTVWSISPDAERAAPQSNAVTHWGTRDSHIMKRQLSFSASPPSKIRPTALNGMSTEPNIKFAATSTTMIPASTQPYIYPLFAFMHTRFNLSLR